MNPFKKKIFALASLLALATAAQVHWVGSISSRQISTMRRMAAKSSGEAKTPVWPNVSAGRRAAGAGR